MIGAIQGGDYIFKDVREGLREIVTITERSNDGEGVCPREYLGE